MTYFLNNYISRITVTWILDLKKLLAPLYGRIVYLITVLREHVDNYV